MASALNTYATLDALKKRLDLTSVTLTTDEAARLLDKLRAASAQIDLHTGRRFTPYRATFNFDYRRALWLTFNGRSLLELIELINGDGSIIPNNAVSTLGNPAWSIEVDGETAAFTFHRQRAHAITVTGIWGYHPDYANAWRASGASLTSALDASSTTVNASTSGADSRGNTPRFQVGQLIRIDSEYLHVIEVNTNSLKAIRAANGTIAAAHSNAAPISIYTPPPEVTEIALRWAGWLLQLEDSGDYGGRVAGAITAQRFAPAAIPNDLIELLAAYRAA
jgi:hypothetical protein